MYYTDKILFGAIIVLALANLTTPFAALCYAVLISVAKEIFDWFNPMDFVADVFDSLSISVGAAMAFCFLKLAGAV